MIHPALDATGTKHASWWIVRSLAKHSHLNCISHLLRRIPYMRLPRDKTKLRLQSNKASTITRQP